MNIFELIFQDIWLTAFIIVIPCWLIWKFHHSYVLGLVFILLGVLLICSRLIFDYIFGYVGLDDFNLHQFFYLQGRRPGSIAGAYGFLIGGLLLIIFQFISETFFGGNKM